MSSIKAALIIVDLQEDFLPPNGSLAVAGGRDVIPLIANLLNKYKWSKVITTKDWHPQDHTSFASNHPGKNPYDDLVYTHPEALKDTTTGLPIQKTHTLWPDHCVQGTKGSEFAEEFIPEYNNFQAKNESSLTSLVKKGYLVDREYYSCFQDTWGLHKTECDSLLKQAGITHVFVVGLAYDYCVMNSAIDAANLGYTTFVLKDCSRSVYPDKLSTTDENYQKSGVSIIESNNEVLNQLTLS